MSKKILIKELLNKHFPTYMNYSAVKDQHGVVFFTVLFVGLLLTFVGLSLAQVAIVQFNRTNENVFVSNALLTAEAGIEKSIYELNNSSGFSGFTTPETFYDEDNQGRATYETIVEPGEGSSELIITSIGRTYRKNSNKVEKERRVRVTAVATASPGYSVHTGPGGLILTGSAAINNSEIYVNGFIQLSGAARIGSQSAPLNVHAAHYNCPTGNNPGPTYPALCITGQPITMSGSSRIYGSVCATNQTTSDFGSAEILPGTTGAGLITGCIAPQVNMPSYDRPAHIAKMTTTAAANDVNYDCGTYMPWPSTAGFVRTMPANIRLNGNASWDSSCDLTITGDVYITGDLNIGGSARIRIADSLGTTRPVIVVDGSINIAGSSSLIPNSSGTAAHFISYKGIGTCNLAMSCSGTHLKQSQGATTVNVAGAGNYPGTVFHSYWGTVKLGGSGNMGSAIGQTVDLSGAGSVVFGTSLATGDSSWTIRSYQYDY